MLFFTNKYSSKSKGGVTRIGAGFSFLFSVQNVSASDRIGGVPSKSPGHINASVEPVAGHFGETKAAAVAVSKVPQEPLTAETKAKASEQASSHTMDYALEALNSERIFFNH